MDGMERAKSAEGSREAGPEFQAFISYLHLVIAVAFLPLLFRYGLLWFLWCSFWTVVNLWLALVSDCRRIEALQNKNPAHSSRAEPN